MSSCRFTADARPATSPIAGFLYFPLHLKKHAKPRYELEYTTRDASVTLELANVPQ